MKCPYCKANLKHESGVGISNNAEFEAEHEWCDNFGYTDGYYMSWDEAKHEVMKSEKFINATKDNPAPQEQSDA